MSERKYWVAVRRPAASNVNSTVTHLRGCRGTRLQRSLLSAAGSMGSANSGRYRLEVRRRASRSISPSSSTK